MKKFSSKFIATAIMAVVMASTMAFTATAADYEEPETPNNYVKPVDYFKPTYNGTSGSGTTSGDDTAADTDVDSDATIVDEDAIDTAIKWGKHVAVAAEDGDAIIQEAAIGKIANGNKPVVFDVADDESDSDYEIIIDPSTIKEVKKINIGMNIKITEDGIRITPAQKGDFGMTLIVRLPASAFDGIDLAKANLYYVDDDKEVTLIKNGFTVNDDGTVDVAMTHASSYVITEIDLVAEGDIDEDYDDDDDDDDDVDIDDDTDTDVDAGKDDNTVVNPGSNDDGNPVTGTALALGSLVAFAAAAVATSKKRK